MWHLIQGEGLQAGEVLDFSGAEKEEEFLKVDSPGEEGPRPNHA
jgi:hypothetical protein